MEWWLWTTYLSGEVYLIGYIVMLPVGLVLYSWFALDAMLQFFVIFEEKPGWDFGAWFMGPFLRGWVTGPFIFLLQIVLGLVPGVNFATSFLLGWWAVADYYGYSYQLFEGPLDADGYYIAPDKAGTKPAA